MIAAVIAVTIAQKIGESWAGKAFIFINSSTLNKFSIKPHENEKNNSSSEIKNDKNSLSKNYLILGLESSVSFDEVKRQNLVDSTSDNLTNIYLKYEADFPKALIYAQRLGKQYPKNYIFGLRYTEALLLNGHFELANQQIKKLSKRNDDITSLSVDFFEGYYSEIHLKNDNLAAQKYASAISSKPNSRYTQEFYAMAHLGMGRIQKRAKNEAKANFYLKKCLENTEYTWVASEAKAALKE